MKIKLDENLGTSTAKVFTENGFETETVKLEGLSGSDDRKLIAVCQTEERCLVTLDLDFSNPFIFDPSKYFGIAILRLPVHPSWQDIQDYCHTLIKAFSKDNIKGKLWIIHRDKIRIYHPDS